MNSESRVMEAIREKVEAGQRLSFEDGLALEASNDLFALGLDGQPGARAVQRQFRLLQRQHAHQPDECLRLHLRLLRVPGRPGRGPGLRDGPRPDRRAGAAGRRAGRDRAAHRRRPAQQAAVRLLRGRGPLDQGDGAGDPHQGVHGRRDRVLLQDRAEVGRGGAPGPGRRRAREPAGRRRRDLPSRGPRADLRGQGLDRDLAGHPPHGAPAGPALERHDALRPHRRARSTGSTTWSGSASSRTRPAGSRRSSRWPSTPTTRRWPTSPSPRG